MASMNPFLFKKLAYDPERALAPVSVLARNPIALVALPSFPAGSVRELVAHARSHGDLSYASTGNGNGTNLAMEMFLAGSAIQMVHVPYKGSAPAMQALLAGQVPVFMSDLPTVVPYARSGKVRVIAVTGDRRSPHLPDVPTFAEAGARGVEIDPGLPRRAIWHRGLTRVHQLGHRGRHGRGHRLAGPASGAHVDRFSTRSTPRRSTVARASRGFVYGVFRRLPPTTSKDGACAARPLARPPPRTSSTTKMFQK